MICEARLNDSQLQKYHYTEIALIFGFAKTTTSEKSKKYCKDTKFEILYFFGYKTGFFSFQNTPKNLDPSYKTDLDLWECLRRV